MSKKASTLGRFFGKKVLCFSNKHDSILIKK